MGSYVLSDAEIIFLPQLIIGIILGAYVTWRVATNQNFFWPMLLIVVICTTGFLVKRLSYLDEFFMACLMAGVLLRKVLGKKRSPSKQHSKTKTVSLHYIVFMTFIYYMIFQSFRGMIILESPRKLLWVLMFSMLAVLSTILVRKEFPVPPVKKISYIISYSAIFYFSVLIIYGLHTEIFRGFSRFHLQTCELSSSAQFMFPVAIMMPAALYVIMEKRIKSRRIGWIALATAFSAALYYDSRVSILSIVGFLIIMGPRIGWGRIALAGSIIIISSVLYVLFGETYQGNFTWFFDNYLGSGSALWKGVEEGGRDMNRILWAKLAFTQISGNLSTFFFGYGFRCHGIVIAPTVYKLYLEYLPHKIGEIGDSVGTEAFTAIVVDTGLVGLLLLILNFILVGIYINRQRGNPIRIALLACLGVMFLWLFVINLTDTILFYFALMPEGLLVQLAKQDKTALVPQTVNRWRTRKSSINGQLSTQYQNSS